MVNDNLKYVKNLYSFDSLATSMLMTELLNFIIIGIHTIFLF